MNSMNYIGESVALAVKNTKNTVLSVPKCCAFWVRLLILSPEVEGALCTLSLSSVLF